MKYVIMETKQFDNSPDPAKPDLQVLVTFKSENLLIDSVVIPQSQWVVASADILIEKALKQRT